MSPLRALARLATLDVDRADEEGRRERWEALVAVDEARDQHVGDPAFRGLCRQVEARIGHQRELLHEALAERQVRRDFETLRRLQFALRAAVVAGVPIDEQPDPDDADALEVGALLLGLLGQSEQAEPWLATLLPQKHELRVVSALRSLLDSYPEPLDDPGRRELLERLVDLHEVRERWTEQPTVQRLSVELLRRAAPTTQLLIDALDARCTRRDLATLARLRWAVRAMVESGSGPVGLCPERDDVAAWLEGGRTLAELGRLEDAVSWFDGAATARPTEVLGRALALWVRWLLDLDPAHRDALEALLADHPDHPELHRLLREMR